MTRSAKPIYTQEEIDTELNPHIDSINNARQWPDTILPELQENQIYHCQHCQNDSVKPQRVEFEYLKVQDRHGKVLARKFIMDWRSDCCDEEFIVWDTQSKQEVPWPETEVPEVEIP